MIECVHAYWLFLWLIALFSRYSHRNCIINYPLRCHGGTMESPDEYLGRLNFPGACGVKGHRGALLWWRNGRRCVCACVLAVHPSCVCCASLSRTPTHTGQPPSSVPLILSQYLFIATLSARCRQMGGPLHVCVRALASDEPLCPTCLGSSCLCPIPAHYSKAERRFKVGKTYK